MEHEAVKIHDLAIGELAERSGCTVPTIRFYEQVGLIPRPRAARAADGSIPGRMSGC
ncbi:MerR family DNA-binding transcriptional regulator [Paracoccus sp. SSJ]|uniref:MerR family DNA-binding transcriptional regulator n=1 Tax=Paracoccus sp. SSJ TaxID=3050636 RepID=UPI0025511C20|nr:MerR family DNA-binding transcriptional regulator [Paracoccus sp. SSJ]MDK8871315.1 MerR family DNA-binding transcriptional regulator [Paracoccus sp. SSJ]